MSDSARLKKATGALLLSLALILTGICGGGGEQNKEQGGEQKKDEQKKDEQKKDEEKNGEQKK